MSYNGAPTQISVVQNDYGYNLPFTLQDSTGAAINLTNNTGVSFRAQLQSNPTVIFTNPMTVTSATNGQCQYTVGQNDFTVAGLWNVQIIITFAGEVVTFTGIQVTVAAEL